MWCDGWLGINWLVRGKAANAEAEAEGVGREGDANWFVFGKPGVMEPVPADMTFGVNRFVFGNAGTGEELVDGELVTSVGTGERGAIGGGRSFGWGGGALLDDMVGDVGKGATVKGGMGDGCGDGEGGTEV